MKLEIGVRIEGGIERLLEAALYDTPYLSYNLGFFFVYMHDELSVWNNLRFVT